MPSDWPPLDLPGVHTASPDTIADALREVDPQVHLLAASALIKLGALEAAWEPLSEAAKAADDPDIRRALAEQLLLLARTWDSSGQPQPAEQALRLAAAFLPVRATPVLARHLRKQGALDEALSLWEDILRLDPSEADHYLQYARLLEAQGRFHDAYATYLRLLHQSPTTTTALTVAPRLDRLASMLPSPTPDRTLRITMLGSATLQPLRDCLIAQAHRAGLRPHIHLATLDPSWREIRDPQSSLYRSAPEVLIVALHRSILFPELSDDPLRLSVRARRQAIQAGLGSVRALLSTVRERSTALILVHNIVVPQRPLLGVRDAQDDERALFQRINVRLARLVRTEFHDVHLVDEDAVQAWCGQADAIDPRYWLAAGIPWSDAVLMQLAGEHVRHLRAHRGLARRCLVLDPDNTLWGGVLGEGGIAGVRLGRHPPDNAYRFFQRELLALHARGVLLAVCSRNRLVHSPALFDTHPDMLVRSAHFATGRVNSQPKSLNVADIGAELNVPLEGIVFWDSDLTERAQMRSDLPQVLTAEVPDDPAWYRQALIHLPVFERLEPGVGP